MLRKIWNAVKAIGAFFSAVIDFVQNIITAIIDFFMLIPKAISYIMGSFAWIPVSILSVITVIITILVIKKVVNR